MIPEKLKNGKHYNFSNLPDIGGKGCLPGDGTGRSIAELRSIEVSLLGIGNGLGNILGGFCSFPGSFPGLWVLGKK